MTTKRFSALVTDQVRMVERRLEAVVKTSSIELINIAQRSRFKQGGRVPVVTGFLRSSGRVGIGGLPKGPIKGREGKEYNWDSDGQADMLLKIANTRPGDRIYFGWTAIYARRMEAMYGFQRGAAEQWQAVVAKNAHRARQEIR